MQFKALLSFLSLSAVVAALPASTDGLGKSDLLLDARASAAFDPVRDHLETESYVATGPPSPETLVSQTATKIFTGSSGTNIVYVISETYFANFTWVQRWSHANPGSSDQVEERKITEGTVATTGTGASESTTITAAFEANGFSFGADSSSETKQFSTDEKSKGTVVTRKITCTAGETTFFYQRQYNFIARLWFLSVVSGQQAKLTFRSGDMLNTTFNFQVDSDNVATLTTPLKSGSKTTLSVNAVKPQYDQASLTTRVAPTTAAGGGPQVISYLRLGEGPYYT